MESISCETNKIQKAGLRKVGRIYLREGDFIVNGKPMKLFLFSGIPSCPSLFLEYSFALFRYHHVCGTRESHFEKEWWQNPCF